MRRNLTRLSWLLHRGLCYTGAGLTQAPAHRQENCHVAALADAGANLIVDHITVHREGWASTLAECVTVLEPFPVYFVGVRCSLEEAKRREQARGDWFTGTAERQFPRVHRHELYDVEVDTTHTSPEVCAEQIRTFVDSHVPMAFASLRQMPRQLIP